MILHPSAATFGDLALDNILSVTIERLAAREVVEFSDLGPHVAYADVAEQRIHINVMRRPTPPELGTLRPGDASELVFAAAAGVSDAARIRVRVLCMVREVKYDFNDGSAAPGGSRASPRQTLTFLALSPEGADDPVIIETP